MREGRRCVCSNQAALIWLCSSDSWVLGVGGSDDVCVVMGVGGSDGVCVVMGVCVCVCVCENASM